MSCHTRPFQSRPGATRVLPARSQAGVSELFLQSATRCRRAVRKLQLNGLVRIRNTKLSRGFWGLPCQITFAGSSSKRLLWAAINEMGVVVNYCCAPSFKCLGKKSWKLFVDMKFVARKHHISSPRRPRRLKIDIFYIVFHADHDKTIHNPATPSEREKSRFLDF